MRVGSRKAGILLHSPELIQFSEVKVSKYLLSVPHMSCACAWAYGTNIQSIQNKEKLVCNLLLTKSEHESNLCWRANVQCVYASLCMHALLWLHACMCVFHICWKCMCVSVCLVTQLYPTVCDPMDCRPPSSSVHEILQAKILEWVAISFSRGSSWPRVQIQISYITGRFFTMWATRKAHLISYQKEFTHGYFNGLLSYPYKL